MTINKTGQIHTNAIEPYQGLFEASSEQKYALGTPFVSPEGGKFRYGKAGDTGLDLGRMCQGPASKGDYTEITSVDGTAGEKTVTVEADGSWASIDEDEFKGGELIVHTGDGKGQKIEIESHPAWSSISDGDTLEVTLVKELRKDISSDDDDKVSLTLNSYNGAVVTPSGGVDAPLVGVPLVDVPSGEYAWFQVAGEAPLYVDDGAGVSVGDLVGEPHSGTNDGACGPTAEDTDANGGDLTNAVYGRVTAPSVTDEEITIVRLMLEAEPV